MKQYVTRSLSFPDEALLNLGLAKAKAERRTFSNYVCGLIEEDLIQAGLWKVGTVSRFELNERPPRKGLSSKRLSEAQAAAAKGSASAKTDPAK